MSNFASDHPKSSCEFLGEGQGGLSDKSYNLRILPPLHPSCYLARSRARERVKWRDVSASHPSPPSIPSPVSANCHLNARRTGSNDLVSPFSLISHKSEKRESSAKWERPSGQAILPPLSCRLAQSSPCFSRPKGASVRLSGSGYMSEQGAGHTLNPYPLRPIFPKTVNQVRVQSCLGCACTTFSRKMDTLSIHNRKRLIIIGSISLAPWECLYRFWSGCGTVRSTSSGLVFIIIILPAQSLHLTYYWTISTMHYNI